MKETNLKNDIKNTLPEEFITRILELNILGFVKYDSDTIEFTDAGKKLIDIVDAIDIENIPDIFVDSEIIKILELLNETGNIPNDWMELLKSRYLTDENGLTDVGREILKIYYDTHPIVYLTPEILSFMKDMPKIGTYDELISYKNSKNHGDNIVNALQAMRLLKISPKTEMGKAFSTTNALNEALRIASLVPKFNGALILKKEDFDALNSGNSTEYASEMGYYKEGKLTNLGQTMVNIYNEMGVIEKMVLPISILDDEINVLKTIEKIEEIYNTNPDILPTYSEISRRGNIENLGEILHLLESKELIKLENIKNKDTYWLTEFGRKVKDFGSVSTDGMKAITYSKCGDVPIVEWVLAGKNEGTINKGITEKGKYLTKLSKTIKRKPYLTKYDVSMLIKIPKKTYIHRDELVKQIQNHIGGDEKDIIRSLSECESKGFIKELQNKEIKLTQLGDEVKTAIEMAKISELLSTKFAITPTTFNILDTIYKHNKEFDKIWKEKLEGKGHKENEVILLAKYLKLTPDVIKKSLVILKNTGFIGKKGLTDAGKSLVEAYHKL